MKTKKGWRVYTHFKCEKCNVALCRDQGSQKRNCFVLYHQYDCNDDFSSYYSPFQRPQCSKTDSSFPQISTRPLELSSNAGTVQELTGLNKSLVDSLNPTKRLFMPTSKGSSSQLPMPRQFPYKFPPDT